MTKNGTIRLDQRQRANDAYGDFYIYTYLTVAPDAMVIVPVVPELAVPVCNVMAPLLWRSAAVALAVVSVIAPLVEPAGVESCAEPVVTVTAPPTMPLPTAPEMLPADIVNAPPAAPEPNPSPLPTDTYTEPPEPLVAVPVPRYILPLLP